jgi:hypothetical protein
MILLEDEVVRLEDAHVYAVLPPFTSDDSVGSTALDLLLGTQVGDLCVGHGLWCAGFV